MAKFDISTRSGAIEFLVAFHMMPYWDHVERRPLFRGNRDWPVKEQVKRSWYQDLVDVLGLGSQGDVARLRDDLTRVSR